MHEAAHARQEQHASHLDGGQRRAHGAMRVVSVQEVAASIRAIDDPVLRGKIHKALHMLHRTLELYRCVCPAEGLPASCSCSIASCQAAAVTPGGPGGCSC